MDFLEDVDWKWSYSIDGDQLILIDLNLDDDNELVYTKE